MARRSLTLLAALLVQAVACGGTEDPVALDQPIVVHQADFKQGALPGVVAAPGAPTSEPRITSFTLGFGVLRPGTVNAQISGRASTSAYSVGVRLRGEGEGFWVRPVGAEDPLLPGELQWQLAFDAATAITPGPQELEVVAFDEQGNPGSKASLPICVASELPDNLNVCNRTNAPPLAIASLNWDADSDLDLTLVAPDGTTFGRSKRSLITNGVTIAELDGDGVSGCLADGRRRESFAWNQGPPSGAWKIYANLFDACGKPAVSFTLTIYTRRQNPDGTFDLDVAKRVEGQVVRAQSNGGAGSPLYLTQVQF